MLRLSMDMGRLYDIRTNLGDRMKESTLCDFSAFAREFESLLSDSLGEPEK
jgi:predicted O-linked N-acetylglucosamine transferase (SPINDLY family)